MEKSKEHFEIALEKHKSTKYIALYRDNDLQQTHRNKDDKCSAKEIIHNISLQLKAIQNADSTKNERRTPKNLNMYKTSSYLPVNMLHKEGIDLKKRDKGNAREILHHKNATSNFETEFVTNTQLISIVEDVESLALNNGVTQEFDTSFSRTDEAKLLHLANINDNIIFNVRNLAVDENKDYHCSQNKNKSVERDADINLVDISLKEPDPDISLDNVKTECAIIKCDFGLDCDTQVAVECSNELSETTEEDIPLSPVFDLKPSIKKSKSPSPLIFDLNVFEKFEKIAIPLVEQNMDLETTKHLINSQIIGKELFINTDFQDFNKLGAISPAFSYTGSLEIKKSVIMNYSSIQNKQDSKASHSQKSNDIFFKDEILFSSDEDEGYIHRDVQDLPFTCALETSFYDQVDILDRTMYVGFQTASNKSIQICTDSFTKAKSMFDNINSNVSDNEIGITEMVTIYDAVNRTLTRKSDGSVNDDTDEQNDTVDLKIKEIETADLIQTENNSVFEDISLNSNMVNNFVENHAEVMESKFFEGFKTASNKMIKLSAIALARSKRIFQDIDCEESINFRNLDPFAVLPTNHETNTCHKTGTSNKKFTYALNVANKEGIEDVAAPTIDDSILKEFESIEMIQEIEDKNNCIAGTLIGFKTASNKNVKITKAAIAKTKNIFSDIELNEIEMIAPNNVESKSIERSIGNMSQEPKTNFKNIEDRQEQNSEKSACKYFKTTNIKKYIGAQEALNEEVFQDAIDGDFPRLNGKYESMIVDLNSTSNEKTDVPTMSLSQTKNLNQKTVKLCDDTQNLSFCKNDLELKEFHSASNKVIAISEGAMSGSIQLFSELNKVYEPNTRNVHKEIKCFGGFQTASNKRVNVSENSLAKSRIIFKEIDDEMTSSTGTNLDRADATDVLNDPFVLMYKHSESAFEGFNNKFVQISAHSLAKSKKKIRDPNEAVIRTENVSRVQGFQTISNVSEDTQAKSRKIFEDIDIIDKLENAVIFVGFQTASKKTIQISKEALVKSREIFENIEGDSGLDQKASLKGFKDADNQLMVAPAKNLGRNNLDGAKANTENVSKFHGFQTASNKKISVSECALAESRKIFEKIDKSEDTGPLKGFQAASNKAVQVSKEVSANRRNLFENIDDYFGNDQNLKGFVNSDYKHVAAAEELFKKKLDRSEVIHNLCNPLFSMDTYTKPAFEGFKTANNNAVQISAQALTKSKEIFRDLDEDVPFTEGVTKLQGFQTASNKKLHIFNDAIAKKRKILKEIDKLDNDGSVKGLQTASNKVVNISEVALALSKTVFENSDLISNVTANKCRSKIRETIVICNNEKLSPVKTHKIRNSLTFKTGNNNSVNVSEDSLQKSKNNFADFNEEHSKRLPQTNIDSFKYIAAPIPKHDGDIDNIINTQVLNNFEETIFTEDFSKTKTPVKSKRSGSPILSCPRPKRRKFVIPYSQHQKSKHDIQDKPQNINTKPEIVTLKPDNIIEFNNEYKRSKKYTLKDIEKLENDNIEAKNVDPYIIKFDLNNIMNFEFCGPRNDITNASWPLEILKEYFLNSVNKKFIPAGWLDNHIKLILWKLISYELRFPKTIGIVCTARNVMEQLKYRYDRELFNAERPSLRKIMERDDVSTKTLVLCIVGLLQDGIHISSVTNLTSNIELILTDGWYNIRASADKMLTKLVYDGRIYSGCKIVTNGAELVGCEQGVSPWENTSSIKLKLFGNSTRRARWDARLGYHSNPAILSKLSAVKPDGGKVSRLRVFVTRVYPMLYVEKFEDGSTVTRSERLEHLHQMRRENERQIAMEKLYEDVEKEFCEQDSQDSDTDISGKRIYLDSGSQIAKVMRTSRDPAEFRSHLTHTQAAELDAYTANKREIMLQNIQARVQEKISKLANFSSNVVGLLKIRVAGFEERDGKIEVTKAMMSIWKPNEAISEVISEGSWIEVMNVVPTAIRYSEIQISAGRQSVFSQSKQKQNEKLIPYIKSMKRNCFTIKDLTKSPAMATEYNEIDTVGLIFLIDPSIKDFDSNKHQFQNIYLADAEKHIISVNFWGGIKKFGFENIIDTGQIITVTNLQKRAGNTRKHIPQYRVTEFTYFTKTSKNETARNISDDLTKKLHGIDTKKYCEDCINLKNNYSVFKLQNNDENISPYRVPIIDINMSKNRIFIDSPLTHKNNRNEDILNLTGLDFESTFKQTDTQELSPKTLLRKKQVNEKIAKLKMYGEPPPLSPIHILNKSKNAGNAFKSPLISKSGTNNVASKREILPNEQKNKEDEMQCSPIIMNKTYVKRDKINPVKLNFSNNNENNSDLIDHFEDVFDGSPPLSLD